MNACERADWFDTEGNLYVSPSSKPLKKSVTFICVSQFDRSPLEDFKEGAAMDGVECRILPGHQGKQEEYMLLVAGLENIAKELVMEASFIRTARKLSQIRNFREFILGERTRIKGSVKVARKLLGSLPAPLSASRRPMGVIERANWFDTEGCLYVSRPRSNSNSEEVSMSVSQSQREPLEDFANGALNDGVASTIYYRSRRTGEYVVRIRRLDHIARELSLEIPFLRTTKRLEQIRRLKEYLGKPRARVGKSARAARGLLPNGPVV